MQDIQSLGRMLEQTAKKYKKNRLFCSRGAKSATVNWMKTPTRLPTDCRSSVLVRVTGLP